MKLNIGSHNVRIKDFLNLDIENFGDVDIICDITKMPWYFHWPKKIMQDALNGNIVELTDAEEIALNDSVDEMLMVEVLEHIPFKDCQKVLQEIYRVLTPGGKIHIQVPDCGSMMKMFANGTVSPIVPHKPKNEEEVLTIYKETGMQVNPMRFLMAFCGAQKYGVPDIHKNIFWKNKLEEEMEMAGFSRIEFKHDPLQWKLKVNAYK